MGCKQTPLPFEIIVYILESYVDTNSRLDGDYMVIPFTSQSKFIQDCKFVRNCSLVSTHWNAASRDVLSRLRTIVGTSTVVLTIPAQTGRSLFPRQVF